MYVAQNPTRFEPKIIPISFGENRKDFLQIFALDPSLQQVYAVGAGAKGHRTAHRDAQGSHLLKNTEQLLAAIVAPWG